MDLFSNQLKAQETWMVSNLRIVTVIKSENLLHQDCVCFDLIDHDLETSAKNSTIAKTRLVGTNF